MRRATRQRIEKLYTKLGRYPRIAIFILPGQPPGPYFEEHDRRINKALEVWKECLDLPCEVRILSNSGTADCNGLTVAEYMKRQLVWYAKRLHLGDVEPYILIGERQSGSTAGQIVHSREDLLEQTWDLIILVSNWWHLLVAGFYFKHLAGLPFVKEWSSPASGCLGLPLWKVIARQIAHYLAAMALDWSGHRWDKRYEREIIKWSRLTLPPIPPP